MEAEDWERLPDILRNDLRALRDWLARLKHAAPRTENTAKKTERKSDKTEWTRTGVAKIFFLVSPALGSPPPGWIGKLAGRSSWPGRAAKARVRERETGAPKRMESANRPLRHGNRPDAQALPHGHRCNPAFMRMA